MNEISEKSDELNPNFPKEWEVSRSLLSFLDDKSYDLRKYGFSFITALIAAEGVLLSLESTNGWPDEIKFAVLLVNILLIVGLTLIDRFFYVIQKATATRARVLERAMNLELTEIITQRYRSARSEVLATVLYLLFIVAIILIGIFTLDAAGVYRGALVAIGISVIAVLIIVRHYIKVDYPHGEIDWTIDRLRCMQKDKVGITLANLSEKEMKFEASEVKPKIMWEVREEGKTTSVSGEYGKITKDLTIEPDDSYTWFWPTGDRTGVYRVYRLTLTKDRLVPLKRKIIVKKKAESKPKPILVELVK